MSEIRLLTAAEVPLLLPLAREFFAEGNLHGKLNEAHFVNVLRHHIGSGSGFVFAAGTPVRGTISGVMFNDMATAEPCCMEFFWYVRACERGAVGIKLLDAWEREAFSRGAVRIMMAHLDTPKTQGIERLYERRGFRVREKIFMKEPQ